MAKKPVGSKFPRPLVELTNDGEVKFTQTMQERAFGAAKLATIDWDKLRGEK